MALPTINVTIDLSDQNGAPMAGAIVSAKLSGIDVYQGYVLPVQSEVTCDANGHAVMALWPNALGATQSYYTFKIVNPATGKTDTLDATLPNADCDLFSAANLPPYPGKTDGELAVDIVVQKAADAAASASTATAAAATVTDTVNTTLPQMADLNQQAQAAAQTAIEAANSAAASEQVVVSQSSTVTLATNLVKSQKVFVTNFPNYSANERTSDAAQAAVASANSASTAETSRISAAQQASTATAAAAAAQTSATNAQAAVDSIGNAVTTTGTNATAADQSAAAAAASETNAAASASAASASATAAATSATNAAQSATDAAASMTTVQTAATVLTPAVQEFNQVYLGRYATDPTVDNNGDALAEGAEYFNTTSNATRLYNGTSWYDRDAAVLSAASDATAAATAAGTSESNAAASASAAATSAGNAATSATNAANSATSAATDAGDASTSATAAATSATSAGNSATAAAGSATAADGSATAAATSATNAANSATAAATSATNAGNSATAAAGSATAAAASADNASNSYGQSVSLFNDFDARYLGAFGTAPTTDNQGGVLDTGALYFDTTINSMQVYAASGWQDLTNSGDATAVKLTGDQTVAGIKTFSASPIVPTATLAHTDDAKAVNVALLRKAGYLLAASAVRANNTGSTTRNVLASVTLPANSLGANGALRIHTRWSYTPNTTNGKSPRIAIGGQTVQNVLTNSSTQSVTSEAIIQNRGTTNSQIVGPSYITGYGISNGAIDTATIDTTVDQTIEFSSQLSVATDFCALESYLIEVIPQD